MTMRFPIVYQYISIHQDLFQIYIFTFPSVRFNSLKENYDRHYIDTNKPITLRLIRSTPPIVFHLWLRPSPKMSAGYIYTTPLRLQ